MTIISKLNNVAQYSNTGRKQLKMKTHVQPELKINVYNYFLDDFPKPYVLSPNDTIYQLKQMIVKDTQIKINDIKNFKDENGKFIHDRQILSQIYTNNSNLNMEIYFNQDLKITTNNKKIEYFMYDTSDNNCNDVFDTIINFHKSEKGGKIIVGVKKDGLIKGINIPEQDEFKKQFLGKFALMNEFKERILEDIDISFFRVKGQNKNTYNYNDHKKIMIIKIKGKNQQKKVSSQASTDDENNSIKDQKIVREQSSQSTFESSVFINCDATQQDMDTETADSDTSDSTSENNEQLYVKQRSFNLFQEYDQNFIKQLFTKLSI